MFGDPDLYARRNVKTDHSNWGVNNIKVNEWKYDTDGFIIGNDQTEPPLAPLYTANSEFYIWDYMDRTAEPLATNLQQALFLWKGKGAKILASMKGVTFIAGCLDGIGKLEVGLIRKSLLQGAVQSTDTFAETDFIKVGNETHTALIEFRGQLWAFSRTQMHRIQMRDMADLDTIEVLEVLENNGTFSPKTVIATPFGVAWCNESGVWLSNGGEPTLLSKEIEPLYLSMVRGTNWISQTGDRLDWDIRGDLYNKKLQIVYDNAKYDLTISAFALRLPNAITPEGENKHLDIRLCYNIVYKNWRIETYPLNLTHTETSFASRHRTHWSFGKYKSLGWRGSNVRVNTLGRLESDFGELLIDNRLVLHEIGNGIDDMQANSVSIEAAYTKTTPLVLPKLTLTTGNPTQPFQFAGRQNTTDPIAKGELVSYHISGITDPYWSENKIDTPIETPAQTVSMLAKPLPLRMTYDMTSQHHHVPFMKPVRRFMAEYIVRGRVRLRSMRFILRLFTRKFWG
ncbi:MAG: hypothetical protein EAZ92_00220 [Candidatus Kapaibacterium sp.]|nr:MAG: hypothetical protein EAZ92_00220 [Candidatus Kapabacteria bacterium]